jgi:hypothetical protein
VFFIIVFSEISARHGPRGHLVVGLVGRLYWAILNFTLSACRGVGTGTPLRICGL